MNKKKQEDKIEDAKCSERMENTRLNKSLGVKMRRESELNELDNKVNEEFKNAAKHVAGMYNQMSIEGDTEVHKSDFLKAARSIASLYRASKRFGEALYDEGYIECLNNILVVLCRKGDVKKWAVERKKELCKSKDMLTTIKQFKEVNLDNKIVYEVGCETDTKVTQDYQMMKRLDMKTGTHRGVYKGNVLHKGIKRHEGKKKKKYAHYVEDGEEKRDIYDGDKGCSEHEERTCRKIICDRETVHKKRRRLSNLINEQKKQQKEE